MTRRAKGWLAVVFLALVLGGFVAGFATTPATRARFWAWRAGSSDRKARLKARERLLDIGRPAIDSVYVDLVAGEICDRLAAVPARDRVVFVGCCEAGANLAPGAKGGTSVGYFVERSFASPCERYMIVRVPETWPDPVAEGLAAKPVGALRMLVIGRWDPRHGNLDALLVARLAAEDPLAATLVEEARARVESAR
ncbi:MAG TPA: hypothetical protein VFF73_00700 [Planctomycetota bacterium]|nr:hypothetical protein [Planctomycetota bacterium]